MFTRRPSRPRRLIRRIIVCVLVATLVVVLGAVGWRIAGPSPSGEWNALDATDRAMFEQLSAQYDRAAADPGGVWTDDFRYEDEPFLLLRTDRAAHGEWDYAFLVNMSGIVDTSGMRRVELPGMPHLDDVRVSKTFGLDKVWLHFPSDFTDVEIAGVSIEAFKFHPGMFASGTTTTTDFRHLSAHEHFHQAVQGIDAASDGAWRYNDGGALDPVPTSAEHMRMLRAELTALDHARDADDVPRSRAAAAEAVQLRLARQAEWPEVTKQDGIETIEGTATYFEGKVNGESVLSGPPSLIAVLDAFGDDALERDLYYSTGASIGGTLDRLMPDWKDRLSASAASGTGPTLFALLEEAVSAPQS